MAAQGELGMTAVYLNADFLRNEGETQMTLVLDSAMALMARARGCGKDLYNQHKLSFVRKLDFGLGENASFRRERISWSKHHTYITVLSF